MEQPGRAHALVFETMRSNLASSAKPAAKSLLGGADGRALGRGAVAVANFMVTQTMTNRTIRKFNPFAATMLELARTIRVQMPRVVLNAAIKSLTRHARVCRKFAVKRLCPLGRTDSLRGTKYVVEL